MVTYISRVVGLLTLMIIAMSTGLCSPLTYTFSTLPANGSISGLPGAEIGWGYSITDGDATNWLVVTNLQAGLFQHATPDASLFDFPIVMPLSTINVPFDPVNNTGLYGLTLDVNAPVAFVNSGSFTLSAEWWTGDPFAGGSFLQAALDQSKAYSASVSAAPVPEPASGPLVLIGLVGCALVWKLPRRFASA